MTPPPTRNPLSLSNVELGEDIDLVVGTTALAITGDQLCKAANSKHHKIRHLVKAGLGAIVTVGAWKMFTKEHREHEHKHHAHQQGREGHYPYIRDRSLSPQGRYHSEQALPIHGGSSRGALGHGEDWYNYDDTSIIRRPKSVHGFQVRHNNEVDHYGQQPYHRSRSYSPNRRRSFWD